MKTWIITYRSSFDVVRVEVVKATNVIQALHVGNVVPESVISVTQEIRD